MNVSQPEADIEYSTGGRGSGGSGGRRGGHGRPARAASLAPRALACSGAALLVAAELSPLLRVRTIAAHPRLVRTVQGGPHHGWALLVIAVLAAALAAFTDRTGGRAAGAMIALLGAGALAITLGVDLHDAHATGLVNSLGGPVEAQAHAAIGLYLETLGAVALLLAGVATGVLDRSGRPTPQT
jgi:hypothetical protein